MLIVWAIGRVPLSWRPPLRKWSAACITKIVFANSSLPPPNKPSNLTPCNEKLPKKADIFTTSYNNTDVHQELLTRLAPLPLTSLGVREVSLAQPEEAEGLGSVEVIEMIVIFTMITMILIVTIPMMTNKRWRFSPWPVSSSSAPSSLSSASAASKWKGIHRRRQRAGSCRSPYEEEQWLLFCWRAAAAADNAQIVPAPN